MSARITEAMVGAALAASRDKRINTLTNSAAMRFILEAAIATEPGEAEGMVLVPREPTPDMLVAAGTIEGWNEAASKHADECHIAWWKAMLAAAPLPEDTHHG